jgi:hypothetical protein
MYIYIFDICQFFVSETNEFRLEVHVRVYVGFISYVIQINFSQKLFLRAFAKLRKETINSVCPHGTTRLPLDRFSSNLMFEDFSKVCRENFSFIKI